MKIKKMEGIIEAILFTMGESVELDKIARTLEQDVETTRKVIHNMMDRYEKEDRGIHKMHFKCVPKRIRMSI